ncbi:MAG: retroviral-like aspartic protease family protein [Acidobacteria bacterium]|nr:retroviral-like aspartic protease family protein [Acidobacteriota bacterium]
MKRAFAALFSLTLFSLAVAPAQDKPAADPKPAKPVPLLSLEGAPEPSPYTSTVHAPSASKAADPKASAFYIPFIRLPNGLLAVMVQLNGRKSVPFVFDTGASVVTVSGSVAESADIEIDKTSDIPVGTASGRVICHPGKVESLSIGDLTLENVLVLVNPKSDYNLFGQNLISDYSYTIDNKRQVIILVPHSVATAPSPR